MTFAERFAFDAVLNHSSKNDALAIRSFLATRPDWLNEDQCEILFRFAARLENEQGKKSLRQGFGVASPGFGKTRTHVGLIGALTQHDENDRLFIWSTLNLRTILSHKAELQKRLPGKFEDDQIAILSGSSKDPITPRTRLVMATPTVFAKVANGEIEHNLFQHINHNTVFLPDEVHVLLTDLRSGAVEQIRKADCIDLGLTATPAFSDGRTVGDIAYKGQEPFYVLPTRIAVQKGYNCSIGMGIYDVSIKVDKEAIKKDALAHDPNLTPARLQSIIRAETAKASLEGRIKAMVSSWGTDRNPYTGKPLFLSKTIDFMPDTASADKAAADYNKMYGHLMPEGKICAASVHSKMTPKEQTDLYKAHARGDIYILTNVRCLAAAHDDPEVENISIIWETESELLLQQEIGRSFRNDPNNPLKFAFARQWVDLEHNPNAVLLTEALDSYDPLVRFEFTQANGPVESNSDHEEVISGTISYKMNTEFHALEKITKLAKTRREKNSMLPPPPPGFVSIEDITRLAKGNLDSLKTRESVGLRKLFSIMEEHYRDLVEFEDEVREIVVHDHYSAIGFNIKAVFAGTPKGNMLHVDLEQIREILKEPNHANFTYLNFPSIKAKRPQPEEVSDGHYITVKQAKHLIHNLCAKYPDEMSSNDQLQLIQYLKACPVETRKTSIGVSTKYQSDEFGRTTGIVIHAKELAQYLLDRMNRGGTDIEAKISKLKKGYEEEYNSKNTNQLFVKCTSEKVKEVLSAYGFKTDNTHFENLGIILDKIKKEYFKKELTPANGHNSNEIEIYDCDDSIIATVEGANKRVTIVFDYKGKNLSNGKVTVDEGSLRTGGLNQSKTSLEQRVFASGYRVNPDTQELYINVGEMPWYLLEEYKGNKFDQIKYSKSLHNAKHNALKYFVPVNKEALEDFFAKNNVTATPEEIEEFVKSINAYAKEWDQGNFGCSPRDSGVLNYHSMLEDGEMTVWSSAVKGMDLVKNIMAAFPKHKLLERFAELASKQEKTELTDADIEELCKPPAMPENPSYLKGFTTTLTKKQAFVRQ